MVLKRTNEEEVKTVRISSLVLLIIVLLVPIAVFGGSLTSISGSVDSPGDFSILALHFDQPVPYTVRELNQGRALRLTITGGQLDDGISRQLNELQNRFVRDVQVTQSEKTLVLTFHFTDRMKPVVWETHNPFSLVFDVSAVHTPSKSSASKAVSTSPVPQHQKESSPPVASKPKGSQPAGKHKSSTPITPADHYREGLALRRQGHLEQALEHFQKARLDPDLCAEATAEIAEVSHQLGRTEEEIAAWERLFYELRISGYSPETGQQPADKTVSADLAGTVTKDSSQPKSSLWSRLILYMLLLAVAALSYVTFRLYRTIKAMRVQLIINEPSEAKDAEITKEEEVEELGDTANQTPITEEIPQPKSEDDAAPEPEEPTPPPEPESKTQGRTPVKIPWGEEADQSAEDTSSKTSEETAEEVHSLSEQGFSIQEIAEKLGLGQDEVRLILNLQREGDKESAEAE